MSATCPKCGNSIEQDFGVAACTNCEAVLFIDMDGNAQLAEEAPAEIEPPLGLELSPSEMATTISPMPAFDPAPVFEEPSANLEASVVEMEPVVMETFSDPEPSDLPPEVFEPEPIPEASIQENTQALEMAPITEEQKQSLAEIEPEGTGIFESTEQVLGGLSYSVTIKNIDTKEIRKQMLEALDDSRFQWDPREVLKTVKAGTLELKNLNPVKASVVVQRMKDLSVKVSWEQHAYN